jgi:hypothetical protein
MLTFAFVAVSKIASGKECPVYMGYFQAQNKLLTPKARGVRQLAQNLFFVTRFSPYDEKSRANN